MSDSSVAPLLPLMRVPPFPGARPQAFANPASPRASISDAELDQAIVAIATARVGGTYWGRQPPLPASPYVLVRIRDHRVRSKLLKEIEGKRPIVCWLEAPANGGSAATMVSGCCDPWHLVGAAAEVVADADDEVALIAALAGLPVRNPGQPSSAVLERPALRDAIGAFAYANPFTGEPMSVGEAVDLSAFWRKLIDGNRPIAAAFGFAAWKRPTAAPLLWAGSDVAFLTSPGSMTEGDQVVAWKSRVPAATLSALERKGARLVEAEDGFIRSVGLGADCVPPLSLVVDRLGAYFDPRQPSELENLLQHGSFAPALIERARDLRDLIVELGVSKYGSGNQPVTRRQAGRRHLLVPGQVEDDRSVRCGGGAVTSNLELLRRARSDAPDAYILYKPHPDVEAGHRVGAIPGQGATEFADEIVRDQPISSLIEMVDEVHVNTSLAGFEALLRGKPVTTHGVPFYAGWGLTRDLGMVPARRTARRTLDEMVAAVLLLYPRYLDPVSGLPCTPEILIRRLAGGARIGGPLVSLRRLQGVWKRGWASVRPW